MKFKDWVKREGKSPYLVAQELGIHFTTMYSWMRGDVMPNIDGIERVAVYTRNEVGYQDFYLAYKEAKKRRAKEVNNAA